MLQEKIIEIKSKTVNNFGEEDVIEIKTVGKYGIKNGKVYVSYDEGGALGVDGVTTILKAQEGRVVLSRTGSLESRLEIEKVNVINATIQPYMATCFWASLVRF